MLPAFAHIVRHTLPLHGAIAHEAMWMRECAAQGQPIAHLWQAPRGWVVPATYTHLPGWSGVTVDGELQVRASGGGLVPQGPGIWNLSLIWPAGPAGAADSTAVYHALCDRLAAAFETLGLEASAGAVEGSFCDGRFNLAIAGQKVVGTAQAWRRLAGQTVGLAHAVIVVDADPEDLARRANAVELALGHERRYRAEAMTSLRRESGSGADIEERVLHAIAAFMNPIEEHDHGLA